MNPKTQLKSITKEVIVVEVPSSRDGAHQVIFNKVTGEISCTCEDFFYRNRLCKHIREAQRFLEELGIICECDKVFSGNIDSTVEDIESLQQLSKLLAIKSDLLSLRAENNLHDDEGVTLALRGVNRLLTSLRVSA